MTKDVENHIVEAEKVIEAWKPRERLEYNRQVGTYIRNHYSVAGFQNKYSEYREIWPFSNEPLKDIYCGKDLNDKKILTIAGSGDHALSAVLCGAKEIDTFDINKLTEYFIGLKYAAIKGLSFQDFCIIFDCSYRMNSGVMLKLYEKVEQFLPIDIRNFWSYFYSSDKIKSLQYLFYHHQDLERDMIIGRIPYMEDKKFDELKERISDAHINFISSDLQALPERITLPYDHINLSNILNCFRMVNKDSIQAANNLKSFLSDGGEMYCAYFPYARDMSGEYERMLEASPRIIQNSIATLDGDMESKILIYQK